MRVDVIRPNELAPDLMDRWTHIQDADPDLHSPFLTPQWTLEVGRVRNDVEIALIEDAGAVRGFFPYQRSRWNRGRPVGSLMCDVQGVIVAPEVEWNVVDLVKACGLTSWEFHDLRSCFRHFQPHVTDHFEEAFMDLSNGYEHYAAERRGGGSERLKTAAKRMRQAEKEVGRVELHHDITDQSTLRSLMEWKSAQYRRTGGADIFSFPWVPRLVRNIVENPTPGFRAMMSSIHIGGTLAAAEMGLCSHHIFHGWLAAYNVELKKYSPGSILMMEIARIVPRAGIHRIELGKNDMPYKQSLRSAGRDAGSGCVAVTSWEKIWRDSRKGIVSLSRSPWLATSAGMAKRIVRPVRGWIAFR